MIVCSLCIFISAPGIISDLTFTSAVTSILLSWQPPVVTNGIVQEYLIRYFSMGSSVVVTPAPFVDASEMLNYTSNIFNSSHTMTDIFNDIKSELTIDDLESIMEMCVYVLSNKTVEEILEADENYVAADGIFQSYNLSDTIVDWFRSENQTVLDICRALKTATEQMALEDEDAGSIVMTENMKAKFVSRCCRHRSDCS